MNIFILFTFFDMNTAKPPSFPYPAIRLQSSALLENLLANGTRALPAFKSPCHAALAAGAVHMLTKWH
jgi:hypothetical protein